MLQGHHCITKKGNLKLYWPSWQKKTQKPLQSLHLLELLLENLTFFGKCFWIDFDEVVDSEMNSPSSVSWWRELLPCCHFAHSHWRLHPAIVSPSLCARSGWQCTEETSCLSCPYWRRLELQEEFAQQHRGHLKHLHLGSGMQRQAACPHFNWWTVLFGWIFLSSFLY